MTQTTTSDDKASAFHHAPFGEERFALLYSDGGIGILTPGKTLEDAREEREFSDAKERDPRYRTKLIRLTLPAFEVVDDPTTPADAPKAEVDVLRERVRDLERQLAERGDLPAKTDATCPQS